MFEIAFTHNSKLAKSEPGWGGVQKDRLPRVSFARKGDPDKKSTWGFPHHWVQNGGGEDENGVYTTGILYLHRGGLAAAWSAANGGRSGQKAEPAVLAHLRKHYSDLGIKPAQLQALSDELGLDINIEALDAALVTAGLVMPDELLRDDIEAVVSLLLHEGTE